MLVVCASLQRPTRIETEDQKLALIAKNASSGTEEPRLTLPARDDVGHYALLVLHKPVKGGPLTVFASHIRPLVANLLHRGSVCILHALIATITLAMYVAGSGMRSWGSSDSPSDLESGLAPGRRAALQLPGCQVCRPQCLCGPPDPGAQHDRGTCCGIGMQHDKGANDRLRGQRDQDLCCGVGAQLDQGHTVSGTAPAAATDSGKTGESATRRSLRSK
eukprot:363655-Chlamydomonas_euryale.AAC.10